MPNALNHFNALALRPDGKFYVVGEAGDPVTSNGTSALFARLTYSGGLDPTFQSGQGFTLYSINNGDPFNRDESAFSLSCSVAEKCSWVARLRREHSLYSVSA